MCFLSDGPLVVSISLGVVLLLVAALYFFPGLRWYIPFYSTIRICCLTILGYNPLCRFIEAVKGYKSDLSHDKIQSRLSKNCSLIQEERGLQLWKTPSGRFWVPEGSGVLHICYMLAEQERKTYGLPPNAVCPGDVVLDCGANIGVFAREAINAGAKLIVAIEPASENVECLRRNLAREIADGRVVICRKGLWDQECRLTLRIAPHDSGQDTFVDHPRDSFEGPEVELTTIDKIVYELKLEKLNFIKMDIEGSEQRALTGAKYTLSEYKPRLAVAVEHTADLLANARQVIDIVWRSYSGYSMKCGPCLVLKNHFVCPEILYFRSQSHI